ncbi:MAG: hypothetical protein V2I33_24530, partial [Kangiellaceae bacterium]|nr:hypothetical protein [Kangiellaceae bacterium]
MNPTSAMEIDPIVVRTYASDGRLLDQSTSGLVFTPEPGAFDTFTMALSAGASDVVGEDSDWTFTLDTQHDAVVGGKVRIYLPMWNEDLNPSAGQEIGMTSNPTCTGVSGHVKTATLTCSYTETTNS